MSVSILGIKNLVKFRDEQDYLAVVTGGQSILKSWTNSSSTKLLKSYSQNTCDPMLELNPQKFLIFIKIIPYDFPTAINSAILVINVIHNTNHLGTELNFDTSILEISLQECEWKCLL